MLFTNITWRCNYWVPLLVFKSRSLCLGATTDNLDPGVLYQVKASYKYQAEDVDELNFEVGEVIDVVEYDDPEEQVFWWTCS